MRRGIVTMLSATAVTSAVMAIAGFTAPAQADSAVPWGRAHGTQSQPVVPTVSYAGYENSGRDFRYVHALISVPDQAENSDYPQGYIQLSDGSLASGQTYARTGVETCLVAENLDPSFTCPNGVQWVAFIETFVNSTNPVFSHFVPLDASPGDGIGFSIYYPQLGTAVSFTVYAPSGAVLQFQVPMFGPIFDHAAGLVDYTNSSGTPIPSPPGTPQSRLTQFRQGAVTTDSGDRGSWTGPWTTSLIEATTNGLGSPQGTVETAPSFLWTDGAVANGAARSDDAFGVWGPPEELS